MRRCEYLPVSNIFFSSVYHHFGQDGLYGVYAEVAQLRTWIDQKIAANGGATFCSAGTTVRSTTPQQTFDTQGKGSKKQKIKLKKIFLGGWGAVGGRGVPSKVNFNVRFPLFMQEKLGEEYFSFG